MEHFIKIDDTTLVSANIRFNKQVIFSKSVSMGLYDRDYTREGFQTRFGRAPQMRMGFPKLTIVVKRLLIINIAVFFIGLLFFPRNIPFGPIHINVLEKWFSVFPISLGAKLQVWRLITYQFLHGGIVHILFNMLGLFFLGPTLERHWGSRRFLIFYLGCGVAGALFYILLVSVGWLGAGPMVGASGAILGMLAACAILFPHFVVLLLFFPVPIRIAAIILILLYSANLISLGANAGGDAAHLAGMAAGAAYVFSTGFRTRLKLKIKSDQYEKKIAERRNLQSEVDRILKKVHNFGIGNLTSKEKKILKKATEEEQRRNRF